MFFNLRTGKSQAMAATVGGYITDFHLEIAKGNVPGHSLLQKYGKTNASADFQHTLWNIASLYTFPTSSEITHLSMSADQATMRGGLIYVEGLTLSGTLITQTVSLDATNTTSAVALTTPLWRAWRMRNRTDAIAGTVNLTNSAKGIVYARMDSGDNTTQMAIYTVPLSYTLYMSEYYASAVNEASKKAYSTEIELFRSDSGYTTFYNMHGNGINEAGPPLKNDSKTWYKVDALTDIDMRVLVSSQDSTIYGGFNGVLIENPTR